MLPSYHGLDLFSEPVLLNGAGLSPMNLLYFLIASIFFSCMEGFMVMANQTFPWQVIV
jgi:hypothetical protein